LLSDIDDGGIPEGPVAAGVVEGVERGPDRADVPGFGPIAGLLDDARGGVAPGAPPV